ncbi:fumarylacetoacetate hydrolase family protein [Cohnella soli]|uniref:Fumarylacetoacetate hydrolase family protein n=1 Tax=Cohnella soli TaxID=425005 RepID=A0ABW0I1D8_9BACL
MKLLTIIEEGRYRLGVSLEEGVLDIENAVRQEGASNVPVTVQEVIDGGDTAIAALTAFVSSTRQSSRYLSYIREQAALTLGPCVTHPNKIICVGLNYRKHAEETNSPLPEYPILFNKFNNTLAGHLEEIPLPHVSSKVDYEAELVVVIGKKAKYVSEADALSHVFGYCNVNDLSARDLQLRTPQWMAGKCCDKFSPLGPYLVTADEVGDPNQLSIKCTVNGEVRQLSNTSDMIFSCAQIVSYVSQHMTLVPGDIIITGTPEGVVLGKPVEQQVYLKPGDVVTIEIEKLGALTNTMVSES